MSVNVRRGLRAAAWALLALVTSVAFVVVVFAWTTGPTMRALAGIVYGGTVIVAPILVMISFWEPEVVK